MTAIASVDVTGNLKGVSKKNTGVIGRNLMGDIKKSPLSIKMAKQAHAIKQAIQAGEDSVQINSPHAQRQLTTDSTDNLVRCFTEEVFRFLGVWMGVAQNSTIHTAAPAAHLTKVFHQKRNNEVE